MFSQCSFTCSLICLNLGAETPNACSVPSSIHVIDLLLCRGHWLLHPRRQEPRGPHRGGEGCPSGSPMPRRQQQNHGQDQGVQGVQGDLSSSQNGLCWLVYWLQSSVDKMMQKANNSMMVGSSSWLDQFTDAFTVQAGECESMHGICYRNTFVLVQYVRMFSLFRWNNNKKEGLQKSYILEWNMFHGREGDVLKIKVSIPFFST